MKTTVSMTVLFLMSCSASSALDTKALYRFCKGDVGATVKDEAEATCGAYIRGVVDGMIMGGVAEGLHVFCPPKGGIPAERARDIVVGYLAAHPEEGDQEAGFSDSTALIQAFHCPKK